jgi:hypothetical protein
MKLFIILFTLAATTYARWASLSKPVGFSSNCPQGGCASPIVNEGKWRKTCASLVKNGLVYHLTITTSGPAFSPT